MIKTLKIALFAVLFSLPSFALAQSGERIVSYNSEIEVFKDASVLVTETIQVVSAGEQIKRGIYRDFPIAYQDANGRRYFVDFELLEVKRNGETEPYHIERAGNGLRIYIGKEDVFIPPGQHTYALTYKTNRQLGFFKDHDELYWNVTGNGWVFEIEQASAGVKLPGGIPQNKITAALYTGAQGSNAKEGSWQIGKGGLVEFKTDRPLNAFEGLTIVVGWPKGIVAPPTTAQNFQNTIKANLDYIVGILGFLLVFCHYFYAWYKNGRDPKKGTVIPQYSPPGNFSPAFLRFITRMGADSRAFAAAIISLAVKGRLGVSEEKGFLQGAEYTLVKKTGGTDLPLSEEEKILENGFFEGQEMFKLEKANASEILEIKNNFEDELKKQAGKNYFAKNLGALAIGILLSLAVMVLVILSAVLVKYNLSSPMEIGFRIILILAFIALNIIFGRLLRAYTLAGRKLMDETEGFKWFLSVTEKDRLAFHNPPEKTPELFEKMLPFALALGVEHKWSEQFANVFAKLKQQGVNYAPAWFYGASLANFNPSGFASDIGKNFTGAVSSASTPPGSSSGFGGGSGGGGGGGGGGGW